MPADHSSIISFSTTLSPNPPVRAGFGKLLLLVPKATNDLNSETTIVYASAAEAQAGVDAGDIAQATYDRIAVAFQQSPRLSGVRVGNVDLLAGTPETYPGAFTRILGVTNDFYGVCIDSRSGSIQAALAATVETDGTKQFFCQNADASWLNSGVPADFSSITAYNRTSVIYHDTATEYADMALVGSRLAFDPDQRSSDWKAELVGVDALATPLTAAQRTALLANFANVGLPFGAVDNFLYPGWNISGRSIYEILSADWFRARVSEDIGQLYARLAAYGQKLVIGAEGQARVLSILTARLAQGERATHFLQGETRATAVTITQDDRDAKQMRFTAEAQVAQSANTLVFNFYLQNEPLAAE